MSRFDSVWWIVFLPFIGSLFQALAGKTIVDGLGVKLGRAVSGALAVLPVAIAFVIGLSLTLSLKSGEVEVKTLFDWIKLQSVNIPFEFRIDSLSMTMVLIVTGIGSLIHMYAVGYMAEDKDFPRFFTYMNLFIAMMLILVLGNNLALTFVGWEGVGLCSYLLIGYWYKDLSNSKAANKAFIVNRIGDWGFTLGMFGVLSLMAANRDKLGITDARWLSYDVILPAADKILGGYQGLVNLITFMLFIGAMGKSAQFPLYIWLPDAMAGPTPVSALIHAATMVTSGVYLLNRMSAWFLHSPTVMGVVALIGAVTALVGALIAFGQTDIKKVLAFSTVSQLGYMFIGCGVGVFYAGIFHVLTHAFFKALLFLGAGAVIHAMAHDQDMRNYGNLRKYLPITFVTMAIAWLAIAGVPFLFAGFWSKEAILGPAVNTGPGPLMLGGYSAGQIAGWVGFAVAFLTACYMTRLMGLTFFNKEERWKLAPALAGHDDHSAHEEHGSHDHTDHAHHDDPYGFFYTEEEWEAKVAGEEHEHHHALGPDHTPHEVSWVMWVPLAILAVGSLGTTGWFLDKNETFLKWLQPGTELAEGHMVAHSVLLTLSLVTSLGGIALGWFLWAKKLPAKEGWDMAKWNSFMRSSNGQFGIDETLAEGSIKLSGGLGAFLAWCDRWLVDGVVNLVGILTKFIGGGVRKSQTGYVRAYALLMQFGVVAFVGYLIYAFIQGAPK